MMMLARLEIGMREHAAVQPQEFAPFYQSVSLSPADPLLLEVRHSEKLVASPLLHAQ